MVIITPVYNPGCVVPTSKHIRVNPENYEVTVEDGVVCIRPRAK